VEDDLRRGSGSAAVWFLLKRYLMSSWGKRRRKTQSPLGVALPVAGIAVGVCAFTVILSVMGGFVQGLKKRILVVEPHIEIVVREGFGRIPAKTELLKRIEGLSKQILAVSPFIKTDVILQSQRKPITALLWGIDTENADRTMGFKSYLSLSDASLADLEKDVRPDATEMNSGGSFPAIIAGETLLEAIDAELGNRLTMVSTQPDEGLGGFVPAQQPVVVYSSFKTGSVTHDSKIIFTRMSVAQNFLDAENEWSGIQVALKEPLEAETVALELTQQLASDNLRAKPWTESNKALLKALKLERWGMSFVLYMVILVGCFSITITLVLAVRRKAREMAILRSLGLRRTDLGLLYLFKGACIGLAGVLIGLSVGLIVLQFVSHVPLPLLQDAYTGRGLPVLISWRDLFMVSLGSLLLSIAASVWPAIEVMRIDPVETLSDRAV
jgi:lipoprotein-releasing system permease protein